MNAPPNTRPDTRPDTLTDSQPDTPPNGGLLTDAELAARLAQAAGRLLLATRALAWTAARAAAAAPDPMALGKAGDRAANRFLCQALRDARPDDGLLSEEEADDRRRLAMRRVWIIDPLDGTREYGEGRADWAVHVGLAIDGRPATAAVALPDRGRFRLLRSDRPVPAATGTAAAGAAATGATGLRMLVSRSRPPALAAAVARRLGASLMAMGSAGAKAMAVVLGEADLYLHSGGQREWDSLAPVAVALANGLHCSRIDGAALRYNGADTSLPDLLICRKTLAPEVLALVAEESGRS